MQNKMLVGFIIAVIIVGIGSFYGGMLYGKSSSGKNLGKNFLGQNGQMMGSGQGKIGGNRAAGANLINGSIMAKDDKSITVKSMDGGSKIILLSSTTQINKSVTGALSDLEVGKNVMVTGTTNSDGSLTAKSVELRTDMPVPTNATSTPPVK
jgi:hypothetical protein